MVERGNTDTQRDLQASDFLQVTIKQETIDSDGEEPYTDIGNFLECAVKDELYPSTERKPRAAVCKKRVRKDTRKRKPRPPKPKTLQCGHCDKAFSNVFHLRDHESSHTQDRVECGVCRLTLRTTSMRAHMYRHTNKRAHQCDLCPERFVRKYSLKEHVLNVHLSEPVTCPICMKTLKRSSLNKHTTLHTGERKHKCEACGKAFNTIHKLKNHLVTHTNERPFSCADCGSSFKNKDSLKAHIRTHTVQPKVKRFSCDICFRKYGDPSHLSVHMKRHLGVKSHGCHLCNKKFLLKSSLRSHLRIHAVPKAFRCQECGRGFDYLNFLDQHIRIIHMGEGTVACPVCNKTFSQRASLAKHRRKVHDTRGAQRCELRCERCDRTFRSPSAHQAHVRAHGGERGFACGACDKTFRHKTGLMRHVKTHAELQFECRTCGWNFTDPERFASHIKFHLLDKPFGCTHAGCPKKFPRRSALNRHLRGAHKPWCAACARTFRDPSRLDRHLAMHRPGSGRACRTCGRKFVTRASLEAHAGRPHAVQRRRFACRKCGRTFVDRRGFRSHRLVHAEDRRRCTVCGRAFRSEGGLTAHQDKEHTAHVERFWCEACAVGFSAEKDLANHLEFHAGRRVLACAVCLKAYTHKATLNRHLKTHGTLVRGAHFRCAHCGRLFNDSRPYGNHLKLHSGENPYECEACGKTFRNAVSLLLHNKKYHKIHV